MDAPPVQYVTTSDGFSIAYAVSGSGPPFLILPGAYEHVQLAWQYPGLQTWLEGLVSRFQLIQIDPRGAGMSTRGLKQDHSVEHYQRDIEAVVDHLRLERFVIYGAIVGADCAVQFALNHPERVSALVLGPVVVSGASYRRAFYTEMPGEDWDLFLNSLVARSSEDSDSRRRRVDLLKEAWDAEDFVLRMRARVHATETGTWEERISLLRTPVLVLRPRDYALGAAAEAMKLARLARATIKLIDGSFAMGDAEQGIRAIETFLAGLPELLPQESPLVHQLSRREIEVLRLVAAGKSNQQIADELVISRNTVRRHVSNVFDKTGVANRAEAASYAHRNGLT